MATRGFPLITATEPTTSLPRAATFPAPSICRTPSKCSAKTSARPCRGCSAFARAWREKAKHSEIAEDCEHYETLANDALDQLSEERAAANAERAALAKTRRRLTLWKIGAIIDLFLCVAIVVAFIFAVRR